MKVFFTRKDREDVVYWSVHKLIPPAQCIVQDGLERQVLLLQSPVQPFRDFALMGTAVGVLEEDCAQIRQLAETVYRDGSVAFFPLLAMHMSQETPP